MNILLDNKLDQKLSDFALVKLENFGANPMFQPSR